MPYKKHAKRWFWFLFVVFAIIEAYSFVNIIEVVQ